MILAEDWSMDPTIILTGTTTYALAFAIGPMFFAPFSEIRGRKPVFLLSGFLLAIANLGCGLTESLAGLLVARFFAGLFSSTFSTMVGGLVADMYHDRDRNAPMAIFAAACFVGTGSGPIFASIIDYHIDWRWSWYILAMLTFVFSVASVFLLSETRGDILLAQQARRLNKWQAACEARGCTGWTSTYSSPADIEKRDSSATLTSLHATSPSDSTQPSSLRWYTGSTEPHQASLLASIRISVSRPLRLLFTEPIVFWFSMWIAFAWAVFYLALAAIELTFDAAYNFNLEQTGAIYTAIPVAAILGATLQIAQEKLRARYFPPTTAGPPAPERHLDVACWQSLLFPLGLFWWGWTCRAGIPWIVPAMGLCALHMGTYTIFTTVLVYTADSYHRLSSSALAAQSLTRNVFGATLPLATQRMFGALGPGGALSLLGGLALLLSAVPWVLLRYGARIRARSRIAREIMGQEGGKHGGE